MNDPLRSRAERLDSLKSARTVLDSACLVDGTRDVEQAIAQLDERLDTTATPDEATLEATDTLLDDLERGIRRAAFDVDLEELRATLPAAVHLDRAGVLDLLDVMLVGDCAADFTDLASARPALDSVITALCTDREADPVAIRHDPVSLTAKLGRLCESVDQHDDSRCESAETDFYAAAQFDEYEAAALEARKDELGSAFFAPRVLRAITTYNASQLGTLMLPTRPVAEPRVEQAPAAAVPVAVDIDRGVDTSIVDRLETAIETALEKTDDIDPTLSVFETPALAPLFDALRRRMAGEPLDTDPAGRVAGHLDVDRLTRTDRKLLIGASGARRDDPAAASILVGLLCRELHAVAADLPDLGISPDVLSSDWVGELNEAIARIANERILNDGYGEACALSELRSRYLDPSEEDAAPQRPASESSAPPEDGSPAETPAGRKEAKRRRKDSKPGAGKAKKPGPATRARARKRVPTRLARFGGIAIGVAALAACAMWLAGSGDAGRASLSSGELAQISSYLVDGKRDGDGAGTAFVGTVDERWGSLAPAERESAAIDMVASLRLAGLRRIMIYDADRRVRIQVLGEGNIEIPELVPNAGS